MKRLCVFMVACLLLASSFFTVPTVAAQAEFDVQSGVLVKYNGSSADVTLPDTVYAVGASAFAGNTTLRSVTLPSSIYSVGERAFYGCTALQSVVGGGNVTEAGDMAFRGTPYLENSTDKYLMLGHVLLWYNGTADSVTIPSHCTAVASYAFLRCEYLQSFTAYEGLISVGTGAFYGCSRLSSVSLPSTVSTVGAYAFDGTPYLNSFGDFAVVGDGVLVKYMGTDTQVTVPDGVKRIAPHAFVSSKLTSVTLPESVYSIDSYAFADCTGLTEPELPDEGLMNIGDGAFRGCKSLSYVKTPVTLSYIGQSAFGGDTALKGAALRGEGLAVSYNAFKGCTSLNYVLLSDGVAAVYANAFDGCTSLEGIAVSPETQEIAASALSGCDKVTVCCEADSYAQKALSAYSVNTVMGDVDDDGELNVIDATRIQYYIAYLEALDGARTASADFNFDGEINILDAYLVQMRVALLL